MPNRPARLPHSELTFDQQVKVRANLMRSASQVANQLHEYIGKGTIRVAGNDIVLTNERLAAYRVILDRTIPTLSSTEITHKTGLEGMSSDQLTERLAQLIKSKPELGARLQEALGGRLIEGERVNPPERGVEGKAEATSDSAAQTPARNNHTS